jgi:nitrogen fixation protein NifX
MKIAVASSDGKTVDQHFGQACHFLIFQMGNGGLEFIELREKSKRPIYDHEYRWRRGFEILKDCRVVFCRRIGEEPRQKLQEIGIEVVESKKETISKAITGYLTSVIQEIKSHHREDENNGHNKY